MRNRIATLSILLVTLFPLFFGADYKHWAQGIVLCGMGLVFIVAPPKNSLGWAFNLAALGFIALCLTAFLPADLFEAPPWRTDLTARFGIDLPGTLSPQPWISLNHVLLAVSGLLWLYYLAARNRSSGETIFSFRAFALALLVLTIVSFIGHLTGIKPPLWEGQLDFGPIANRNQMALILSLNAVALAGCSYDELARKKPLRALAWISGLPLIFAALIVNQSRAGILLFFAGLGLLTAAIAMKRRSGTLFAGIGSALLLLAALFFLFGGQTLQRFSSQSDSVSGDAALVTSDARVEIFAQSVELISQAPLLGVGLGNFGAAFALNRDVENSPIIRRVAQPDNDWLWLAAETGLIAVALCFTMLVLLGRKALPLLKDRKGRHRHNTSRLRLAAAVCFGIFLLDGIVSIPGHRLSVFLLGSFLLSVAVRPERHRTRSLGTMLVFRFAGLLVTISGASLIAATAMRVPLPGPLGVEILSDKAYEAKQEGDYDSAIALLDRAIAIEPLRYRHYFKRAVYRAEAGHPLSKAIADFEIARHLEPSHPIVPMGEARFWLSIRPRFAVPALREAIERSPLDSWDFMYFVELLEAGRTDRLLHRELADVAAGIPRLELAYLNSMPNDDFSKALDELLEQDPALDRYTNSQKASLFELWYYKGDRNALVRRLESREDWLTAGWKILFKELAAKGNFQGALELAAVQLPPPDLPRFYDKRSLDELRRTAFINEDDVSILLRLSESESRAGNEEEALEALRRTTELPACPPYAHFLLARKLQEASRYKESWESLNKYIAAASP